MYYLSVMYSYNVFIAYIGLYVCIAVTLIVLCLAMHPCIQWAAVGYDDEESMSGFALTIDRVSNAKNRYLQN